LRAELIVFVVTVLATLFLMLACAPALWAQQTDEVAEKGIDLVWRALPGHSLIREINKNSDKYMNEKVEIIATNTGPIEGQGEVGLYLLQDTFAQGSTIVLKVGKDEKSQGKARGSSCKPWSPR